MRGKLHWRRWLALALVVWGTLALRGKLWPVARSLAETQVRTTTSDLINDEILAWDTDDLGVPLGSLILPELLSGKGPEFPVRIVAIRNSDAAFHSHFSQAGINQTLQRLTMEVIVDVTIFVLGQTQEFSVSSAVVVAETIIVGEVPETYLQTGGHYGTERENQGAD